MTITIFQLFACFVTVVCHATRRMEAAFDYIFVFLLMWAGASLEAMGLGVGCWRWGGGERWLNKS